MFGATRNRYSAQNDPRAAQQFMGMMTPALAQNNHSAPQILPPVNYSQSVNAAMQALPSAPPKQRKRRKRDVGEILGLLGASLSDLNNGGGNSFQSAMGKTQQRDNQWLNEQATRQQQMQKAEAEKQKQARLQDLISQVNGGTADPRMQLAAALNPDEFGKQLAENYGFNTAAPDHTYLMGGRVAGQAATGQGPQSAAGQYGADMQNGYISGAQGQGLINAGLTQAQNEAQAAGQYTLSSGGARYGLDGNAIAENNGMTDYQAAQIDNDRSRLSLDRQTAAQAAQAGPKRSLNGIPMMGPNGQFSIGQLTADGQLAPASIPEGFAPLDPYSKSYQSSAGQVMGKGGASKQLGMPAAGRKLEAFGSKVDLLNQDIDRAMELADGWNVGPAAQYNPMQGGTDLDGLLRTITGNSGFDELQAMRDNSPTGGALGQVSNTEIGLLSALKGDLQRSQSPEQFKRNLSRYKTAYSEAQQRMKAAYELDLNAGLFNQQAPQIGTPAPVPSPLEGGANTSASDWMDVGGGIRIRELN